MRQNLLLSCPPLIWLYKYNRFGEPLSWWSVQFGQFLVCCSSAHGAPVPYRVATAGCHVVTL